MKLDEDLATAFSGPEALVCPGSKANGYRERRVYRLDEIDWSENKFDVIALNEFATRESRDASNVLLHRSGLVELDFFRREPGSTEPQVPIPPDEQEQIIKDSGLPWSLKIWSGSKSWHYIWCLEEPIAAAEEYQKIMKMIVNHIVPHADRSNTNPNKFRRRAGAIHTVTGNEQRLAECRGRISTKQMIYFLSKHTDLINRDIKREKRRAIKSVAKRMLYEEAGEQQDWKLFLTERTKRFMETGANEGDRHDEVKSAVINLYVNCGRSAEEIEVMLQPAIELCELTGRGDLEQILNWAERNLVSELG